MIIDRIETLDRRRKKIFADGEFAFALYLGEIRQLGLEEGGELAEELYQKILREIIFKRARERAVYWLKCSARTEEELRRTIRQLRSRIKKIAHAERGLTKALEQYTDSGQMSLPLEGGDTA